MFEKETIAIISRVIEFSGVVILVIGLLTATSRYLWIRSEADISPYQFTALAFIATILRAQLGSGWNP